MSNPVRPFFPITSLPNELYPYWIANYGGFTGYNKGLIRNTTTGSVLPNCTGWSYGAFMWHAGLTSCNLLDGNAGNWYAYTSDGYERGQEPRLGGVMCFSNSGAGHVCIVEEILDPDRIRCSESDYSGNDFTYRTRYRINGWNEAGLSNLTYQGCIYAPVDYYTGGGMIISKGGAKRVRKRIFL